MDASRNARQEYLKERINGAMFFDIDEVSDKDSSLPHMLPSPEQFAEHVGKVQPSCKVVLPLFLTLLPPPLFLFSPPPPPLPLTQLGVGNEHHVVVYDNNADFGIFSAPRVWWMMRVSVTLVHW